VLPHDLRSLATHFFLPIESSQKLFAIAVLDPSIDRDEAMLAEFAQTLMMWLS
jgi:hypothetical protein